MPSAFRVMVLNANPPFASVSWISYVQPSLIGPMATSA